jgi:hypothetical protein
MRNRRRDFLVSAYYSPQKSPQQASCREPPSTDVEKSNESAKFSSQKSPAVGSLSPPVNSLALVKRSEESISAQVHMIEMITLFWLFFMATTFVIQLQVPDPESIASDSALHLAAEDAWVIALSINASGDAESSLHELLVDGQANAACDLLLDGLPKTVQGNCWLASDSGAANRYGSGALPQGRSLSNHHLLHVNGSIWTVSLQVWHVGGGA